jgi:hypothetical protein
LEDRGASWSFGRCNIFHVYSDMIVQNLKSSAVPPRIEESEIVLPALFTFHIRSFSRRAVRSAGADRNNPAGTGNSISFIRSGRPLHRPEERCIRKSILRFALIYNSDRSIHLPLLAYIKQLSRTQLVNPRSLLFEVPPALDPRLVDIDKPQNDHGECSKSQEESERHVGVS